MVSGSINYKRESETQMLIINQILKMRTAELA
jgi:hypothetical protein